MSTNFEHIDRDGDTLRITPSPQGVVVRADDHEEGDRVEVAIRVEDLPRLINALVNMLGEQL